MNNGYSITLKKVTMMKSLRSGEVRILKFRSNCGNVADSYYSSLVQESDTFTEWADGMEMAPPKGYLQISFKSGIHKLSNDQTS